MQKYSLFCYYEVEGKKYSVYIRYKGYKSSKITYSFKDGAFYISAPNYASKLTIRGGLIVHAKILLERDKAKAKACTNKGIHILGEYQLFNDGFVKVFNKNFLFINLVNFYEKVAPYFQKYLEERVRYYEKVMNITNPYTVKVRNKRSNFGVNSRRTHAITFADLLIHYSPELIDAVVVHELAHHFEFNHSRNFYNVVYRYMPDYDARINKINKRIYKWLMRLKVKTMKL